MKAKKLFANVDPIAWVNALDAWHQYPHKDSGKMLMRYLGVTSYHALTEGISMPVEAERRLRMLLSPHAQTIIKAWYAKHY